MPERDANQPTYDELRDAFDAAVQALKRESCSCSHPAYGFCNRCSALGDAEPILARAWGLEDDDD
jgi:hypothetical protein